MKTAKPDPDQFDERRAAMMGIVGLWKDRTDLPDTETYIRNLRNGSRLEELQALWRRKGKKRQATTSLAP
jgi:hypothetical protein